VPEQNSRLAKYAGLGLAAVGLSHFVAPKIYDGMTKLAYPDNTRTHVYIDGGIETVVGLAIAGRRTRKLGLAGLLAYQGLLIAKVVGQK
jgi:uncharacterized membrane protein